MNCKEKESVSDKTMSGSYRYYGGYYNVHQADCRQKTYNVLNPNYGKPGEPITIDVQGFELNLWAYPAGESVLLSFNITGNLQQIYNTTNTKPNGFKLYMYEKGTNFKRHISGNGDSAWIELTSVNYKDGIVSGKFYTFDKSLISNGSDHYAITSGEFKNVEIK
ncbi:MAG: hypothetical protein HUU47_07135 [Bacteroidetes bacterium]|nr:hypothetical protein [Bacteroidota bacterium]